MNLRYLGDALDHWKGSIFEALQEEGLLKSFQVDAMASDMEFWKTEDQELYAQLLRIRPTQLVQHRHDLRNDRIQYFSELSATGDIFLDPDTGIRTGAVSYPEHYLTPNELNEAMKQDEERLVIVYQHVRAQLTRQRVESVWTVLDQQQIAFSCTSYESGTAALLFFGIGFRRVKKVHDYLGNFLGRHATNRIGYRPPGR
jgi:hypothetical protein